MKKLRIIFLPVGGAIFAFLVYQFGIDVIVDNIARTGWGILLVFSTYLVVYFLNAVTWWIILDKDTEHLSFPHVFSVIVTGFAINYVTPVVSLGGEPYKAYTLAKKIPTRESASSVILYTMLHMLSHLFIWLTAIVLAVLYVPLTLLYTTLLVVISTIVVLLTLFLFSKHREGIFEKLLRRLEKFRFLWKLTAKIKTKEETLLHIDANIVRFYGERKSRFYSALALEYLSRVAAAFEIYLIFRLINVDISYLDAFYIFAASSLVTNVIFFVPFELGVKEGGLIFILQQLALSPALSIYIGIMSRIREFFWILIGLLFMAINGGRHDKVKRGALFQEESV
jgi:uncharacterized protein (TIRG00374 family)